VSQRHSEYERLPNDLYITPQWVWDALYSVEPWAKEAWDCCPANADFDFLDHRPLGFHNRRGEIATNPPYGKQAERIIKHAIDVTRTANGRVAMLLPHAYDCAAGRVDLFKHLPFKYKWTLTKRIQWDNLVHTAQPSSNHAWYIWDWKYIGPPKMGWL
jgi:hypothetical protein